MARALAVAGPLDAPFGLNSGGSRAARAAVPFWVPPGRISACQERFRSAIVAHTPS
jgi:hypothetical protein